MARITSIFLWILLLDSVVFASRPDTSGIGKDLLAGQSLVEQELYDSALTHFITVSEILEQTDDDDLLADVYLNISECYFELNDCGLDKLYIDRALDLKRKVHGNKSTQVARVLHDIGLTLSDCGDSRSAFESVTEAYKIFKSAGPDFELEAASAMVNLGWMYGLERNYDQAFPLLIEGFEIRKQISGYWDLKVASAAHIIGYFSTYAYQFEQAEKYVPIGLEIRTKLLGPNHHETVQSLQKMGECLHYQRKYMEGVAYYQRALSALAERPDISEKLEVNPTIEEVSSPYVLRQILSMKVRALRSHHSMNRTDTVALELAEITNRNCIALSNEMLNRATTRESMLSLMDGETYMISDALMIDITRFHQTGDTKYVEHAINIMERGKNQVLRASIKGDAAIQFADIPQHIQQQESQLDQEISSIRTELIRSNDAVNSGELRAELLVLKRQYDELINSLEKDFPTYHRLKYEQEPISVSDIQRDIGEDEVKIAYFDDYHFLIGLGISKDSVWIKATRKPKGFGALVDDFSKIITQSPGEQNDFSVAEFRSQAQSLYNVVLGSLIDPDSTGQIPSELTIVPDGILNRVPFELLIADTTDAGNNFSDQHYLIRSSNIHYAYSLEQEFNRDERKTCNNSWLGIAPIYDQSESELSPLNETVNEVAEIQELVGGNTLLGETSTKSQFLRHAPTSRIIHLAMHTILDDRDPMRSRFAFSGNQKLEEQLMAGELFELELCSQLAVLSGCETGIGKHSDGEGALSLSRAFAYAGCPAMVVSLWKSNDRSNREVMVNLYRQLKSGLSTSEALRQAKLEYLNNSDELSAHPYYWATNVLVGHDQAIDFRIKSPWRYAGYGFGALIATALLFLGLKHKRKVDPISQADLQKSVTSS